MNNTVTWSGRDMFLFRGDRLKFGLNTGCLSDEFRDFSSVSPGKSAIVPHSIGSFQNRYTLIIFFCLVTSSTGLNRPNNRNDDDDGDNDYDTAHRNIRRVMIWAADTSSHKSLTTIH
jgi:hypothetical protein